MLPIPTAVPLAAADVVLVRHGETAFNRLELLNGDPSVAVPLTAEGRAACAALAPTLATVAWQSVFITRFERTRESLALLWPEAPEPTVIADLDDIDIGFMESGPRTAYVEWRRTHGVTDTPEGGESRAHALGRYARGLARVAVAAHPTLVVAHDQPIRYLLNTLADADPILGPWKGVPNATPFAFTATTVSEVAGRMAARARALGESG